MMTRVRATVWMVGGVVLVALALAWPVPADANGGYRKHYRQGFHDGGHHWRRPGHRARYPRYHRPLHHPRWHGRGRHSRGSHISIYGSNHHLGFALGLPLVTYRSPPPVTVYRYVEVMPPPAPPAPRASALPPGCTQTREFRTEIVIDGRRVPAYGTACLMPDGTWKQLGLHVEP